MVEAAVLSSTTGSRVTIEQVLADARTAAIEHETRPQLVPLIAGLEIGRR
jgi:hypothetical protein